MLTATSTGLRRRLGSGTTSLSTSLSMTSTQPNVQHLFRVGEL
jgi:hypothetical protein